MKYNLDLGDRRANAAKEFLVQPGVPADRLKPSTTAKGGPFAPNRTNPAGKRTGARISRWGNRIKRRGRDWTRGSHRSVRRFA